MKKEKKESISKETDLNNKTEEDILLSERKKIIAEFNTNNSDNMTIDPSKVPTKEDIENAKNQYEQLVKELSDKKDYFISDSSNSLRVANFLKTFISKSFWQQRYFVGVINFVQLMDEFIESNKDKEVSDNLTLEYGPMQFAFLMLENYAGYGLDDANHMANIWDEYLPIYETFHKLIDEYKEKVEDIKRSQQIWAFMEQGYYAVSLDKNIDSTTTSE